MSVLYVEGFETSADQPDVNGRGLLTATSPVTVAGAGVLPVPSRTGVVGTGLMLRGPYSTAVTLPNSAAATPDFGMLPLSQSVYSLWQAGGFVVGFNASFNSLNTFQVAPGDVGQIAYDGSVNYWAVCYTGAAYVIAYSADLKNWTQCAAQPATVNVTSSVTVAAGSGSSATVIVNNSASIAAASSIYYTTNLGAAWSTLSVANSVLPNNAIGTTNANAPIVGLQWVNAVGYKIYYYTTVSGSSTLVSGSPVVTAASANTGVALGKQSNGMIMLGGTKPTTAASYPVTGLTSQVAICLASNNPTVSTNWTVLASSPQQLNDFIYFNGYVIGVGYGGLWWNTGSAASAWTLGTGIPTSGAFVISAIATNGTVAVAVGTDPTNGQGAIWTSTNGTTWTKANRFLLKAAASTTAAMLTSVFWDGARFVASGSLNNSFVAVSPDGVSWSVIYATDFTEQTGTANASFLGVFSGQQVPATGIFTPWGVAAGNVSGVGLVASAVASSARTVTVATVSAGAFAASTQTLSVSAIAAALGQQPPSTLSHYYELVFTTVPGTVNLFNVSWAVDNTIVGQIGQYQLAANTDTAGLTQLFFNLPRTGQWTVIDDIYLTNFTGPYHIGRLGVQRIYPFAPSTDVTDNFTTSITGATNSNTVNSTLANSEGYVASTAATAQDIYGTTNSVPSSGTTVNAVLVEGFLSAQNLAAGTGTVGLQSNGVQKLAPAVNTSATPARAALIQETDPNTNVPWTIAGLNAVDIVVAKTS